MIPPDGWRGKAFASRANLIRIWNDAEFAPGHHAPSSFHHAYVRQVILVPQFGPRPAAMLCQMCAITSASGPVRARIPQPPSPPGSFGPDLLFRVRFNPPTLFGPARAGPFFLTLEHDPEKWTPVFGQDHAQPRRMISESGSGIRTGYCANK